jgi:heavy metal translocating P-type ATPase
MNTITFFSRTISLIREYPIFALVGVVMVTGLGFQLAGAQTTTNILLVIVSLVAAIQIVVEMVKTIREGGLGLDVLALTAIIVGLLLQEYWAAVVIALMLTGGEALEDYAERRATNELTDLMDRAPKQAHLLDKSGDTTDVRIESVKVGDRVLVKPGEVIPVDGKVVDGTTSLDESSLTGESLPVAKKTGDQIMSGAVNVDTAITITAIRTSEDSQYSQIIKLVREATTTKSPFVRLADRYSLPFTAISYVIAFTAWIISGDAHRFLEVIVVATPCPLLIGAPVAIISGMSRAAKHGIIIKNGSSLERLAAIKSIAFDKTGTLTKGKPVLEIIETYGDFDEQTLLGLAAAVEANSAHILANAVVAKAKERNTELASVRNVSEDPGFGLRATWNDKDVLLGKYAFLHDNEASFGDEHEAAQNERTTTFIAVDSQVVGALHFTDGIREEAKQTITDLREGGIEHVLMLTGDNASVAKNIAHEVGITEVYAGLLPKDKVIGIKNIDRGYHPTGMVGDGVNDAPVLAASDVGIALGARGSTAASESADVVIMLDNIYKVAQAVRIAKDTIRIGLQSIWAGIIISVGMMLVFSTGHFPAVLGAALQEVVDVVVIINALRAHGSFAKARTRTPAKPILQS